MDGLSVDPNLKRSLSGNVRAETGDAATSSSTPSDSPLGSPLSPRRILPPIRPIDDTGSTGSGSPALRPGLFAREDRGGTGSGRNCSVVPVPPAVALPGSAIDVSGSPAVSPTLPSASGHGAGVVPESLLEPSPGADPMTPQQRERARRSTTEGLAKRRMRRFASRTRATTDANAQQFRQALASDLHNFSGLVDRRPVLVVDDNAQQQEVIREALTSMGLDVSVVSTGKDALELINKGVQFLVVITKLNLPGKVSGLHLVRLIGLMADYSATTIVLAPVESARDAYRATRSGSHDCVLTLDDDSWVHVLRQRVIRVTVTSILGGTSPPSPSPSGFGQAGGSGHPEARPRASTEAGPVSPSVPSGQGMGAAPAAEKYQLPPMASPHSPTSPASPRSPTPTSPRSTALMRSLSTGDTTVPARARGPDSRIRSQNAVLRWKLVLIERERRLRASLAATNKQLEQSVKDVKATVGDSLEGLICSLAQQLETGNGDSKTINVGRSEVVRMMRSGMRSLELCFPDRSLEEIFASTSLGGSARRKVFAEIGYAENQPRTVVLDRSVFAARPPEPAADEPSVLLGAATGDASSAPILKQMTFDVGGYKPEMLCRFVLVMFDDFGLLQRFKISDGELRNFVAQLRTHYRASVPFHNFLHAFDVLQMIYVVLTTTKVTSYLTNLDVLALLVAALGVDVGHPGLDNDYQITAQTSLAVLYNDAHVLENHHASLVFRIASLPNCNIFSGLSRNEFRELRNSVISCILATDMSRHVALAARFSEKVAASSKFDRARREDRQLLLNVLLHAADLSYMARPPPLSLKWAEQLFLERSHQRSIEIEKGYVAADSAPVLHGGHQVTLVDSVALPLYGTLQILFPRLEGAYKAMRKNRELWVLVAGDEGPKHGETRSRSTSATSVTVRSWGVQGKGPQ